MRQSTCSMRVLVVDSSKDGADSLALLLELTGHEVRVAYDGPEALKVAAAFQADAVVAELALPGMDGYQFARRLRRQGGLEEVLLVALTGYSQESYRRRAREAGFNLYLVKPAEPATLQRILARREREQFGLRPLETMPGANRSTASNPPGKDPWISLDDIAQSVNISLHSVHTALGITGPSQPPDPGRPGFEGVPPTTPDRRSADLSRAVLTTAHQAQDVIQASIEAQCTALEIIDRSQRARERASELRQDLEARRSLTRASLGSEPK